MKNYFTTRRIAGLAILLALEVIFQVIGNLVPSPVSVNFALIPIAVGAMLYGPVAGLILGVVNGIVVLTNPSVISIFCDPNYPITYPFTFIVCPLKAGLAGLAAGFVFKALKNKNFTLACILASVVVPFVNTGVYALGFTCIWRHLLNNTNQASPFAALLVEWIGFNFFIELGYTLVLSPSIVRVIKVFTDKEAKKAEEAQ